MSGLVCRDLIVERRRGGQLSRVLDAVSAHFEPGTATWVSGVTGAGKTTLLHVLGGLLRPTAGEVVADGEPVSRWVAAHRDRWRREVGFALQSPVLFEDLTALENAVLPLVPRARSLEQLRERGHRVLERLALGSLAGEPVSALSGGERHRVHLARALVGEPRYLLADEPTAHQDDASTALVIDALLAERDRGAVVVVCAHDPRLAGRLDTPLRLTGGKLER